MPPDPTDLPAPTPDPYTAWCREYGVPHAHCPYGCEHPQPFVLDGVLVCGSCACKLGLRVEMAPCTPDVCD